MTSMGALTWAMSLSERGLRLDGVLQRLDERLPVAFSDIDSFGGGQQPLYQGNIIRVRRLGRRRFHKAGGGRRVAAFG